MHALVAEDGLGVGAGQHVVELDGNYPLGRDVGEQLKVKGLVRADPVPGIEDELGVLAAGALDDGPGLLDVRDAAVGHGLDADGVLAGPAAELAELLGGVLNGVGLHEAAVYVLHAEEPAHVEADLLLVHLLVAAVVLGPEGDVLDLGDGDVVLLEDGEDVLVVQALGQGVHVGLGAQADALEAGGLGGGDALFKLALVAQGPGADGQRMILGHFYFLPNCFRFRPLPRPRASGSPCRSGRSG